MSETKVPSIPPIPAGTDPALYKWLQAVQQIVLVREGQKGDSLDANVTFRDLIDAGIAVSGSYKPNPNTSSPVDAAAVSDSTPPPDPFNIGVSGNVESILVTWELPAERANLAFIKVWRSVDNNFGNAAIAGTGVGSIYVDYDVTSGTNYHYWLQAISKSDVEGAVIDAGTATPGADPTSQLTQLKSFGVEGQPYYYVPTDTVVNGVTIPKGTYMWNAMIGTATIGTAQIKDAAITSAKVSNLTADKITFNQAAGQILSAAVINGAVITGTTSISAPVITGGAISGTTITGGTVNGTVVNGGEIYVPNSTTWKFKVDSTGNMYLRSGTSGARLEITNNVIKVYDAAGVVRVKIGDLAA